ncbi:radical SAM/SPASM domain-containing protein [Desulfosarcina ovata]|uniref:Radical SAM protein n=1 Tax=Desulfosarcina ovata subsp. ovata TaxID=2752305 RepID=A0A5K8ALF9_9BACT|nr:radical SAM protein [Desulfosarcina ovata]BBO92424.1 radical SAM protein [Desulfosarcina ovata subsp. ovata]
MACSINNRLHEFEIDGGAIARAASEKRLLTMEIEFSLRCNFHCPYCYVPTQRELDMELTPDEIRDVLVQARDLGARRIIILGGEPSIYPRIREMIDFILDHGMAVEMFTNGSGISADFAQWLHARRVRVVLKMNTFDPALQDRLAGREGAAGLIASALKHLKTAGYPSGEAFLAISTIICRPNLSELPRMWCWLRDQGIAPYFEIITPQGSANQNPWLSVDPTTLKGVFETLCGIDRERYGRSWEIQPPLVGNRCLRHQFSCLVTASGNVTPCVGVTLPIGNIRSHTLQQIIQSSPVLDDLRNYRQTIKGPCRNCEKADGCYGCRGAAYQITGDYLASDPLCWRCHSHED